ncbi:MAG: PD40 domain-containing protein [Chloroflexi bacterium]|nr:PD40 domain-containing protein [Chloroflexota bacterium]
MRRLDVIIAAAILLILLVVLAVVYARDLLFPPTAPTSSVEFPNQGITPVTPLPFATIPASDTQAIAVTPTPSPQPISQRLTTPTPEPGGRVLVLSPGSGDVGWWSSTQHRRANIGDSFLYAGFFEQQVFIAAARWDISRAPRGAPLREAILTLTGLRNDRLRTQMGASWTVQLLASEKIPEFSRSDFQTIFNATPDITLFPVLEAVQLVSGQPNQWTLDEPARKWLEQQIVDETGYVVLRIVGPVGGEETLFAWDSGAGPGTAGNGPQLLLNLGPAPATPPPTPTRQVVIATLTATPENVLTVAAQAKIATVIAKAIGTYTPTPDNIVTPTPFPANLETVQAIAFAQGLPPVILHTPVPENQATGEALARYATAVALTTGTFTPVPADYVTPQLILPSPPSPPAANVATAAARLWTATAEAARSGPTATPLPYNAVLAQYVYATSTPENIETIIAQAFNATAIAVTTGTTTPLPWNVVVIQPPPTITPIPTQLVTFLDQLTATATPLPTPTPPSVLPADFIGKILFWSNREGGTRLYSLDPSTERIARVADRWPYDLAKESESLSPFGSYQVIVHEDERRVPQVYVYDGQYNVDRNLSQTTSWAYDPVWSPRGDWIAFVSQEPGNDEIYIIDPEGKNRQRLTNNGWEWDKHPTWSPDGSQIVFYSNREVGRRQLWVMNADGSNQRRLLDSPYEDWDPVWVK